MQKVTGIGGLFFKAKHPAELSAWYSANLGVDMPPATYDDDDWKQDTGPTVFAPMSSSSSHFKNDANLYINFRVDDLEAMCTQLTKNGIEVEIDPESYPNGKFASLSDPEGNQIQLWQVKTQS